MKRGLFGLTTLVLLLSIPSVFAAETFLDLLFGTSDESLLFLKIAYAMLVFIIFVKVCKESVFTKEQEKLANMFALLLAFFTLRFTPDSWVENFGWIIMAVAPLIIFYKLYAVFVKQEEGKFSWIRFILALISTLFLLFALGSTDAFGISLGSTPYIGGFFDEFFSDAHYYLFSSLSPMWSFFFIGLLIGGLFLLLSKIRGGTGTGGSGGPFLTELLWVLGIALILGLLGALLGGSLGGLLSIPGGLLGTILTGLGWLALLALAVGLIYLFIRFEGWRMLPWVWARFTNNWSWLRWLLLIFLGIAAVIALLLYFPWLLWILIPLALVIILYLIFRNRTPGGAATNGQLVLNLQAGGQNVGNIAQAAGQPITVAPGSATPFVFTAYRRRILLRNVPLAGANFTVIRVNNGTIAPVTGTTDAQGVLRPVPNYTARNVAGNAQLHIELTHAEINPATVIPDRAINIGAMGALNVQNPAPAPGTAIDVGNPVDIVVEVNDGVNGINGANVEIIFPRTPGLGPLRRTTSGGSTGTAAVVATPARRTWYGRRVPATPGTAAVLGRPGVVTLPTPPFTAAGTYNFEIAVTANGFANPAALPGAITVNNPRRDNLEIFNHRGLVGRAVVTGTPPVPVRVGQRVDIELFVRVPAAGATAARMIDTATVTILPAVATPARAGMGRYTISFVATAAMVGPQRLVLEATLTGYNNAPAQYLDIEVEDLLLLNVAVVPPVAPFRAGMPGVIEVEITNAAGARMNANVEIIEGARTGRVIERGRSGVRAAPGAAAPRNGSYYYAFTAPTAVTGIMSLPFTIRVQEPNYQGPVEIPLTVVVEPLENMDVTIVVIDEATTNPVTGNLRVGQRVYVDIIATNRATGVIITAGTASLNPSTIAGATLLRPSGPLTATGHRAIFTGTAPGRYAFNINILSPGYSAPRPIPVLTLVVELGTMTVNTAAVTSPLLIGDSTDFDFTITDAGTGAAIPGGTVTITPNAGLHPVPGAFTAGRFTSTFRAGTVGIIPFAITIRSPGYRDSTSTIPIEVVARPMTTTIDPFRSPLRAGDTTNIDIHVIDRITGVVVPGALVRISNRGGNPLPDGFSGPTFIAASGIHRAIFAPTTSTGVGNYHLEITVTATNYTAASSDIRIAVERSPHMRVTVNWVPEPANRYMLMNFVVLDSISGNPIDAADISMNEIHTHPVHINGTALIRTNRSIGTTNNAGQLPTEIRIDLGGRVLARVGDREAHRLQITVTHLPYAQRTGTIDVNFSHPRAAIGAPQSKLL